MAHFTESVLKDDGTICRATLGKIIFANADARTDLERILHPLIAEESAQRIAQARSLNVPLILYEAALLIESGRADTFRPLIVVWSDPSEQIRRLKTRDGLDHSEAMQRLQSQMPIDQKKKFGDHLLENNHSLSVLRTQTVSLWHAITEEK